MVAIKITDHVEHASSYEDGQKIFDLLVNEIKSDISVELSFQGIHAVPSAFINAALVQLIEVVPKEQIFRNLKITNSTKFINELIKRRFSFVGEGQ